MASSQTVGYLVALGLFGALLVSSGCGCVDDSLTECRAPVPERITAAQIGMDVPPVPVRSDDVVPPKVDVMFLMDDSFLVTQRTPDPGSTVALGLIDPTADARIKADVAQDIFRDTVDDLMDRLKLDGVVVSDDEVDLAFGVSRFEDYANFVRAGPSAGDPFQTQDPVDEFARPFILNQPILRQDRLDFLPDFVNALARENPQGNGGRFYFDAQSALEALYQLAVGDGFDGDLNGSTTDSGLAGDYTSSPNPQTDPGPSGDVPAPVFTANGTDADGEPQYTIGNSVASGNIGGAGWRPNSIRFVVLFSDIATITPLLDTTDPDGPISNTPSAAGEGPRRLRTVSSIQAFAATDGTVDEQAIGRFGPDGGATPVAPLGAATLTEVITALNAQNIEVISIGHPEGPGSYSNKPNQPDPDPPLPPDVVGIEDPMEPPVNQAPFTYMSALAILTDAVDTDVLAPPGTTGMPLVYNLTTLSPNPSRVPAKPKTDDLTEDLSDRIAAWWDFKTAPAPAPSGFAYYYVTFDATGVVAPIGTTLLDPLFLNGDDHYVSQGPSSPTTSWQIIKVETYDIVNDPVPDSVRVAFGYSTARTDAEPDIRTVEQQGVGLAFTTRPAVAGDFSPPGLPTDAYDPATGLPAVLPVIGTGGLNYPAVPAGTPVSAFPVNETWLMAVTTGDFFWRDLLRGKPDTSTDIRTMAGPIDSVVPTPYKP